MTKLRLRSSVDLEQPASNRRVVGSNPTGGAICLRSSVDLERHAPDVEVAGSSPAEGTKGFFAMCVEDMTIKAGRLVTKMLMSDETWERLKPRRRKRNGDKPLGR